MRERSVSRLHHLGDLDGLFDDYDRALFEDQQPARSRTGGEHVLAGLIGNERKGSVRCPYRRAYLRERRAYIADKTNARRVLHSLAALPRAQEHPAHRSVHRAFPSTVPGLLEGLSNWSG